MAVVYPRPGALIGPEESVYPRGVLTTTGSGAITGHHIINPVTRSTEWITKCATSDRSISSTTAGM